MDTWGILGTNTTRGFSAALQILAAQYEERLEELKVELQEARDSFTQMDSYHNEMVMQVGGHITV